MSHKGKTHLTIMFTATPENVAEGDRIFKEHAEWMARTHHRSGELALLSYSIAKGAELANPLDPSSKPTGNTTFVLTEVYETPAGVQDHWQQGMQWKDFNAIMAWAGKVKVSSLHGSPIVHSLW